MNSTWPLKLPKHKKVIEMLKMLWPTEEEAQIIAVFKEPLMDQKGPRKIAKLTGIPLERVIEVCEKMMKRGVILKEGKKFALLPIMPGLFEFYFISQADPEESKKVAKLFHEIVDMGLMNEWFNSDYRFFRTLPSSSLPQKTKTKRIEIEEEVGAQHEILVFESVEEYVKLAKSISVVPCASDLSLVNTDRAILEDHNMSLQASIGNGHRKATITIQVWEMGLPLRIEVDVSQVRPRR